MKNKQTIKEFERKERLRRGVVWSVIGVTLAWGGIRTYQEYDFIKEVGSPTSKMFTNYKNEPVLSGKEQNTPSKDTEQLITEKEDYKIPAIYVFYKVGCSNCQSVFQKVKQAERAYQKTNPEFPVYWVNVESEAGKSFASKFELTEAASLVLVNSDGLYQSHDLMVEASDSDDVLDMMKVMK